jgi:hypothetical protein
MNILVLIGAGPLLVLYLQRRRARLKNEDM